METTTAGESLVVEFNAKAIAPVSIFKADTDVRYYLNGICVQPGPDGVGCFVIGCDGHSLALWYDKDGKCSHQVVLRVSRELVSASRKKGAKDGRIVLDAGRLVIVGGTGEECFVQAGKAEVDMGSYGAGNFQRTHEYPDVFRVIPKDAELQPGAHGAINGRYLEDIGKASRLVQRDRFGLGVWHFTNGNVGPVVTRFDGEENFLVVTMPMRSDGIDRWSKLPASVNCKHLDDKPASVPATASYPMGSMGEAV